MCLSFLTHSDSHQAVHIDYQGDVPLPLTQNGEPVWIGNNSQHPDRALSGWIDEVAIFSRALSAEEVAAMYDAGNPAVWSRSVKPTAKQERM